MHYTLDGLVIREMAWGENDKRIVLLTANRGRVSILAKGARSMKSKYMNAIGLFTYGNYEVTERNGYAWLSGASIHEPFFGLRNDIERLALSSYVVDLAGELSGEEEPAEDILRLTLNTLYAIEKEIKPPEQIKATYELRAMSVSGYMPDLSGCSVCGSERFSHVYLDAVNGVLKCSDCLNRLDPAKAHVEDEPTVGAVLVPLSMGSVAAARYVIDAPMEKVLSLILDEEQRRQLSKLGETYAIHQLEKRLSSLDFYTQIVGGTGGAVSFHPQTK